MKWIEFGKKQLSINTNKTVISERVHTGIAILSVSESL